MRAEYLNIMWDSYLALYGEPMPVDVWTMHIYILGETDNGDAHLAIGVDPDLAIPGSGNCSDPDTFCHAEHDRVDYFVEQVVRMREWMADHGQRDKPLLLTEFGILKPFHYPDEGHPDSDGICSVTTCPSPPNEPDCFCDESNRTFNPSRVSVYLTSTLEYLRTAADATIGFPADEDRLVQQALWYRLATPEVAELGHASNLADPAQAEPDGEWALTVVGQNWQDYARDIAPTVNLTATAVPSSTGYLVSGADAVVTLRAGAINNGNVAVTGTVSVTFYADSGLTMPLGSATLPELPGCARREVLISFRTGWPGATAGTHPYWFRLNSPVSITESRDDDNIGSGTVHISGNSVMLPMALRAG
jgi:hypothetical protein